VEDPWVDFGAPELQKRKTAVNVYEGRVYVLKLLAHEVVEEAGIMVTSGMGLVVSAVELPEAEAPRPFVQLRWRFGGLVELAATLVELFRAHQTREEMLLKAGESRSMLVIWSLRFARGGFVELAVELRETTGAWANAWRWSWNG
jgi:hypothetical protein